jgi:hypothetical protein
MYEVKTVVARYPTLTLRAARWRGRGQLVHPGTDLLIEAYPRSANSFAVAAFRLAQGRPVDVAHHTHAPGHVKAAVKLGVPALVLIREPEDSVLEFVIVRPELTLRQALRGWVRFYEALVTHRGRFVVGSFRDVTSDFGVVIRRVNDRFGTTFNEFEHTEQNVDEVFRQMKVYWSDRLGPGGSIERFVGRPSEVRDRWKEGLRGAYRDAIPDGLRSRADSLYRTYVNGAAS